MNLTCSSCKKDVPEGAVECPACKAGIHTVMFGRKRPLTKTMIGRAIELRHSIPWATASAIVLLDDPISGKKKVRPVGALAVLAIFGLIAAGAFAWLHQPQKATEPPRVLAITSGDAEIARDPPEPITALPAPKVAKTDSTAEKPAQKPAIAKAPAKPAVSPTKSVMPVRPAAKTAAKPAPKPSSGTLAVNALHKGKPVAARVFVNGEDKGQTPLKTALAPGKYTLKIVKAGFKTEKRVDVAVTANRSAALKVDLKK